MAKNEIFRHGDHMSLPVPSGTKPGDPVKVGALNGVAQTAVNEGGNPEGHASVWLSGVHTFPVTGAVEAVGAPIYIADGALNAEGTDVFGIALATQSADGDLPVKIIQTGATA